MADHRSRLADADSATLADASPADLIRLIEWMRETHDIERALAMCTAYERGVLDERHGRIPLPARE